MPIVNISTETRDTLQKVAEQRGMTVAQFVNGLVPKLSLTDETVKTILLKVPVELLDDQVKLEKWVLERCRSLTKPKN